MKHKVYAIVTLLVTLCLLTGCFAMHAPESTPPTTVETTGSTTETEGSIMDAESLYWKMRYATGSSGANQYTTVQKINMRVGSSGVYLRTDLTATTRAFRSADPFAVNLETETYYTSMDLEVEQKVNMYYRIENTELTCYIFAETLGIWERQVIDASVYDILQTYTAKGYPSNLPDNLTISDDIQILEDREVYVLSYNMSGQEYFGIFGDEEIDASIAEIEIPIVTYVDAETYLPIQIEVSMHELGTFLSELIFNSMGGIAGNNAADVVIEINDYTIITKEMIFETVDVPDIPEDGLQKAQQAAGFNTL